MSEDKHFLSYKINRTATNSYGLVIFNNHEWQYSCSGFTISKTEAHCKAFNAMQWIAEAIEAGVLD